jgi:flagellar basal body-associated protein FliL
MKGIRGASLFVRIAILILLVCLGVLFLAASIMSRKYAEEPDESSTNRTTAIIVNLT